MLTEGMSAVLSCKVTKENSAKAIGSGSLLVFGTPAMIALIEQTAVALLEENLPEGMTTVGTKLDINHVSATPLGMTAECECTLTKIDRKKLVFDVVVKDEAGIIGNGTHERFMVDAKRFQEKADSKAE